MTLGYLEFRDVQNTKIVMPMAIARFMTSDAPEVFVLKLWQVMTPQVVEPFALVYTNKEARDKDLTEVLHYSGLENKFNPSLVL